jgi:hypothetical protein
MVAFISSDIIFTDALIVFLFDTNSHFAILQSTIHDCWSRLYASSLKNDVRYVVSDCFETFPFPSSLDSLESIGERYHSYRKHVMAEHREGLTATYNHFHNPEETAEDIGQLRTLHVEMDNAVASAYGWTDLDLGHGFHETRQGIRFTMSEAARREVLDRLLALNHERHAAEIAAAPEPRRKRAPRKRTLQQSALF